MIKVNGWQVAPAELEAVILTHPQVINAAVIGIPIKDGTGEVPAAFVVLKPRALDSTYASHGELEVPQTTEEELKTYLAARLAKYKALNGVIFVDDIPRTASGKLQKVKLRGLYANLTKTLKRKNSEMETTGDPNDTNNPKKVKANGNIDVFTPDGPQTGQIESNCQNREDPRHDALICKRVKAMPRAKLERSFSSAPERLMTERENDGQCI